MSTPPVGDAAAPIAALLGAGFGLGLVTMARGLRPGADTAASRSSRWPELVGRLPSRWRSRPAWAAAVCAGLLAGLLTGWPVAGVLVTVGALTLPGLLGRDRRAARRTARMEALATWTEMLRDTLSAAAGLEQAILATADIPPAALEDELRTLAADLRAGRPVPQALEDFAQRADDPLADVIVTALTTAARQQASQLAALLGELADSVREQVAMRQRIDAGRASVRTGVRVTVTVTLSIAAGMLLFNRAYLDPFDSLTGQLVLATIGMLFTASFSWLSVISRIEEPARLLTPHPKTQTGGVR